VNYVRSVRSVLLLDFSLRQQSRPSITELLLEVVHRFHEADCRHEGFDCLTVCRVRAVRHVGHIEHIAGKSGHHSGSLLGFADADLPDF
jgi:hypothetical protein